MLPFKLRNWVDANKINEFVWNMCANKHPAAMYYVEKLLIDDTNNDLDWGLLSANPSAIHILERYPEKIDWDGLSMNSAAMHLLEKHPEKINWEYLNHNKSPKAIQMLKENPDKIFWYYLSQNSTAINMILEYIEKNNDDDIDNGFWEGFTRNSKAVEYLKKNKDKICYYTVISNSRISELLELLDKPKNYDIYNHCGYLSSNPNPEVVSFFEKNPDKIDYLWLAMNPAIFEYDYIGMRESRKNIHEELMAVCWHPNKIAALLEKGIEDF